MDKLIEIIRKTSLRETNYEMFGDDFNPRDASGGNFDDAYDLGRDQGEIYYARFLMEKILEFGIEIPKESKFAQDAEEGE